MGDELRDKILGCLLLGGLSLPKLAELLGYPKLRVAKALQALMAEGFVVRSGDRRWVRYSLANADETILAFGDDIANDTNAGVA